MSALTKLLYKVIMPYGGNSVSYLLRYAEVINTNTYFHLIFFRFFRPHSKGRRPKG